MASGVVGAARAWAGPVAAVVSVWAWAAQQAGSPAWVPLAALAGACWLAEKREGE